jgi:TM2 domain-containing membrane protein YozV
MQRTCSTCNNVYSQEHRGLRFCPRCGELLPQSEPRPQSLVPRPLLVEPAPISPDPHYLPLPSQAKSPTLAALLSFLLVGMGQVYLGQVEKGLTMLGVVLLLMLTVVLGPLGLIILLLNVSDAFLLARKIRAGKPIRKWEFFFSRDKVRGISR